MGRRFNHFHKLADELPERAHVFLDAYQAWWVSGAKQFAPVDTGDLRDSIGPAAGDGEYQRRVVATMAYAVHQEFGTMYQPGTPFMRESRRALWASFKRDGASVFGEGFSGGGGRG